MTNIQKEETMNNIQNKATVASAEPGSGLDTSWRGLYIAGGISGMLYVLLALVVPTIMIAIPNYDLKLGGHDLLQLISENTTWWMLLQGLVLETSVFLIIMSAALYFALRHLNKSLSAIGALVLVTSQFLFMAYYPVLLGLTDLSKKYAIADGSGREILATAAEALIAQNSGFNPVYEFLFAAGIMLFSVVMLKGVFGRFTAWTGIASLIAAVVALALFPVIGLAYFFWWVVPTVWLVVAGWRLIAIGRKAPGIAK